MLRRIGSESVSDVVNGEKQSILFPIGSVVSDSALSVAARFNSSVLNAMGREGLKEKPAFLVVQPEWVIYLVGVCQTVLKETALDEWPESLNQLEDLMAEWEEALEDG